MIQRGKSICWGWSQVASVTLQCIENGLVGLQRTGCCPDTFTSSLTSRSQICTVIAPAGIKARKPWGCVPLCSFEHPSETSSFSYVLRGSEEGHQEFLFV